MDVIKKRKKLGLSLKTTKKTAVDRSIISTGQRQVRDFLRGKDSYNPLQENSQLAACNRTVNDTIIIDDDDPQETAESGNIAGKTNYKGETKEQSKTSTDFEKGFERDAKRIRWKKLVSKDTDWKMLDDLPCQPLAVCQSTSKLSENLSSGSRRPAEMKQTSKGKKISSLLAEVKVETQSVNKNVDFIYSFYSDLPKACMVCSTRKPLRVAPFGFVNPTSVSNRDEQKSQFSDYYSKTNGGLSIKKHILFDNDEENIIINNSNAAIVKTLKQKSGYDEAVPSRSSRNRGKLSSEIKTDDAEVDNEVTEDHCFTNERRFSVNFALEKKDNSFLKPLFSSTCNLNTNQELSCSIESNNLTGKSSLSSSGFSIKKSSIVTQDTCLSKDNNTSTSCKNRFAGFRTSDSTKPLIENCTVVETRKLSNGNIKNTSTEGTSYPHTKLGGKSTFKSGKDASVSNGAPGQPSFHFGKKLQDDVSSELSSCPMCQQEFPNWTSSKVEDHISNCPGLGDFIGDEVDNEIEW